MISTLALYLGFGSIAGILSGLFGIGGGIVIVPFLAWQLTQVGFPAESVMVAAIATSLATIVVTSISAIYAHHRLGSVCWQTVIRLSPGILAGAVTGSFIAHHLPVTALKLLFALFLIAVAFRMLARRAGNDAGPWRQGRRLMAGAGFAIGALSAVLGIGGGTISVPFLSRLQFPMQAAVATSSACGFPIAVAGTASYIALGWGLPGLPADSLGYVHLPAFAGIVSSSTLFAPLGAHLAHRLPTFHLKRLFALILFLIGSRMLWQNACA